jgi:hypothetical protein
MRVHFWAASLLPLAASFRSSCERHRSSRRPLGALAPEAGADDEQRALALSDYLAKAHEEKLRAIQDVEKKKALEIEALKNEIQELKATQQRQGSGAITMASTSGASDDLMILPKEALVSRVIQYQKFMEKYMVEAQEQKIRAVKAAEESLRKKFGEQLALGPAPPSSTLAAPVVAAAGEAPLYQARNAAVTAAAAAGKSRWGDMEVQRARGAAAGAPGQVTSPTPTLAAPVPPEVLAADHGLRSDGSVGGLTLAERVAQGAGGGGATTVPVPATTSAAPAILTLYDRRNIRVLEAAQAGKSRWGSEEVERVRVLSSALPPAAAASSGGTALAESVGRVNIGAQILLGKA